ncbi:hypothetical protein [Jannaschia sp. M317]|uniref:hypothetical protein n=1 Tax=Jannaschia sp. M317 TaxID=2867011 RepID=UPI0021A8A280|nr:hypothetical protein [Jannaschia sp. M317]UWQ19078.1 hypothetical protein K3551_07350 [Jannaschia sp. M317]
MVHGDLMKKHISTYGRDEAFRSVVEQIIGEEERKNKHVLARSLRASLDHLGEGVTAGAMSRLLPFPDEMEAVG